MGNPEGVRSTPLAGSLTHSTSGVVTGSNARLGTSAEHQTRDDVLSRERYCTPTLRGPRGDKNGGARFAQEENREVELYPESIVEC